MRSQKDEETLKVEKFRTKALCENIEDFTGKDSEKSNNGLLLNLYDDDITTGNNVTIMRFSPRKAKECLEIAQNHGFSVKRYEIDDLGIDDGKDRHPDVTVTFELDGNMPCEALEHILSSVHKNKWRF